MSGLFLLWWFGYLCLKLGCYWLTGCGKLGVGALFCRFLGFDLLSCILLVVSFYWFALPYLFVLI